MVCEGLCLESHHHSSVVFCLDSHYLYGKDVCGFLGVFFIHSLVRAQFMIQVESIFFLVNGGTKSRTIIIIILLHLLDNFICVFLSLS